MDASDWIALGSLVVAVVTLVWSRRDVAKSRNEAALASADAAEARTLLERATEAQESQAAEARRANELASPPIDLQPVRMPSGKSVDEFRIYNYGIAVAHGVTAHKTEDGRGRDLPGGVDLGPGEATQPFSFFLSMQSPPPRDVLVSCDEWGAAKSLPLPSREAV